MTLKKLDFVYFEAGGGHRAAAQALKAVIEEQQRPWEVRLVNLQEILDPLDIFRKYTGVRMEDVYNLLLKKGWTLGSPQLTVLMHGLIRLYHPSQVRLLKKFWAAGDRDLVVSLIPNFNRALRESLPETPFRDHPDRLGRLSAALLDRAPAAISGVRHRAKPSSKPRALGYPPERVFRDLRHDPAAEVLPTRDSRPRRRAQAPGTRPRAHHRPGPVRRRRIERHARHRAASNGAGVQFIFICGRNQKLAERLRRMPTPFPKFVEGFTSEIPYYMHLADFFVGKPGPGSISEALAMHLPVVVECNAWTLPQERYNTEWIREREPGVVLKSFRDINAGLRELLDPANFTRFRSNAAAIQNRAVFEIPGYPRFLTAAVNPASARASPTRNSGQLNGFGMPPASVLRQSQTKAQHDRTAPRRELTASAAAWAARCPHAEPPSRRTIMVSETSTGAHTGPTQGSGIRNRMSQVASESGQWISNLSDT